MSRNLAPAQPVVAVGVVCLRDDNVLLIRRANPPRRGRWSLPGGHLEFGETVTAAALRELSEETAVTADLLGLVEIVDLIDATRHYVILDYAARWRSGEPVAGDDALEARFVPTADLAPYDLSRDTLRIIAATISRFGA